MRFTILALGIGAHVASTVLHHYSGWVLAKLLDGGYLGLDLARDAFAFARWLLQEYVHRWCGGYSEGLGMN